MMNDAEKVVERQKWFTALPKETSVYERKHCASRLQAVKVPVDILNLKLRVSNVEKRVLRADFKSMRTA